VEKSSDSVSVWTYSNAHSEGCADAGHFKISVTPEPFVLQKVGQGMAMEKELLSL
jgi:hypothetical protein